MPHSLRVQMVIHLFLLLVCTCSSTRQRFSHAGAQRRRLCSNEKRQPRQRACLVPSEGAGGKENAFPPCLSSSSRECSIEGVRPFWCNEIGTKIVVQFGVSSHPRNLTSTPTMPTKTETRWTHQSATTTAGQQPPTLKQRFRKQLR